MVRSDLQHPEPENIQTEKPEFQPETSVDNAWTMHHSSRHRAIRSKTERILRTFRRKRIPLRCDGRRFPRATHQSCRVLQHPDEPGDYRAHYCVPVFVYLLQCVQKFWSGSETLTLLRFLEWNFRPENRVFKIAQ